ncbi:hypothetical protein BH11MYX3_BH11MYX3_00250 [soil metagenome]
MRTADEELATVVDRARAQTTGLALRPPPEPPSSGSSPATAGPRGKKALRADEVVRFRGMAVVLGLICTTAAVWFELLGGDPALRLSAVVGCAYFAIVCTVVTWRAKPNDQYVWLFRWFAVSAVAVSVAVLFYIGLFSPAPVVVTLGISFIGSSDDRRWGIGCCLAAIAAYALIAILIAADVVPDTGMIRGLTSTSGRIFGVVMVPFVQLATLRQALLGRRTAHAAMAQVEDVARVVQQREAQLAEANLDLQHALEVGANKDGRFTGHRAGTWVLGPVIGRGAMGEVYSAHHATTSDRAAVKILVARAEPAQLERFRREAEIAARVRAPGLAAVFEAGTLESHVPYIVMELLDGHDLAWHLRKAHHLPVAEVIALCDQIAVGLDAAHSAGIVHRDIKPQNLFLHEGARAAWKLLDFGVSKLADSHGTLTQNMLVGTPSYMAPEQARGESTDERSDLFSMGAVLYRALTGQPPFRGNDTPQILFDVVYRAPRQPTLIIPALHPDVELVLAIAIAKRPADRFGSGAALATALRSASKGVLVADQRARARKILDELPWGGRLGS